MARVKLSQEMLELRDVMQIPSGRAVITRLLDDLGYWSDTFNEDPIKHAKLSGARSTAVNLVSQLEANLSDYWILLLTERMEKHYKPHENNDDDNRNDNS
jgi:hypothetical protein